jgi:anti-sigma factor RsiW
MNCASCRELLTAYLDETLDEVRRNQFRTHLRSCARCREHALGEEPTLVFALTDRPEPEPAEVEACVAAVVAGIRHDRLRRQLRSPRRGWLAAAAAVLIAVTATATWWLASNRVIGIAPVQADARGAQIPVAAVAERAPAMVEPPPRVEVDMTENEVRVYQYATEDDATGAIFIVNPAMEL